MLVSVVLGFLKIGRDRSDIERSYATSVASQGATFVELFLVRELAQLHAVQDAVRSRWADSAWAADTVSRLLHSKQDPGALFDVLWVVESSGTVRALASANRTTHARELPDSTSLARAIAGLRLDEWGHQQSARIGLETLAGRRELVLAVPARENADATIVGTLPLDSLYSLLRGQPGIDRFAVVLRASSGDSLILPAQRSGRHTRTIEREIKSPAGVDWTLAVTYSPSSNLARIALPVVGILAITGLGIGLLLERREARRIADRSSELEHLSAELLRANRAKSEFLANVSHELRTPLNAIVGFVDLLRDGVYGSLNPRQVGPVERIEASANHLRHLVDQVLDLAKMAAGRLEVHTEPLELRPFVFDVASEVEPLITEKGLSFSLAVGASLPRVRTDPTHLRQILINLLGNAVKFTNTGGISVRGRLVGGDRSEGSSSGGPAGSLLARSPHPDRVWIALQVADSGSGIPEKDRERIFDEFEQVNAGPRGDSMRRGTGLGLSISRRLARLLGGDITVESELGRGSVFTVWLPVDPADLRSGKAA